MSDNTFNFLDLNTSGNEELIVYRIIEAYGSEMNEESRVELKEVILSALQRVKSGQVIYPIDEFHNAQRFSMKMDVNDES